MLIQSCSFNIKCGCEWKGGNQVILTETGDAHKRGFEAVAFIR